MKFFFRLICSDSHKSTIANGQRINRSPLFHREKRTQHIPPILRIRRLITNAKLNIIRIHAPGLINDATSTGNGFKCNVRGLVLNVKPRIEVIVGGNRSQCSITIRIYINRTGACIWIKKDRNYAAALELTNQPNLI